MKSKLSLDQLSYKLFMMESRDQDVKQVELYTALVDEYNERRAKADKKNAQARKRTAINAIAKRIASANLTKEDVDKAMLKAMKHKIGL